MKISVLPGTPEFAVKMARDVERNFVSRNPQAPVKLPFFASTDLPDPAGHIGAVIWVNNLNKVAVSDGTHWYPLTLGAAL